MGAERHITLRGVEVHNLRSIDLDIPHRKLIVLCGLSGSGKSSLAFDTLFAEGQRRYIETFSAYTRQFLERLEKPAAERIDGIPPAISVASRSANRSSRSTIGTTTEINDHLRLLYARIGQVECRNCRQEVRHDTPQSAARLLSSLPSGTRFLLAFPVDVKESDDPKELSDRLREDGFVRVIANDRAITLAEESLRADTKGTRVYVVVDRLVCDNEAEQRVRESLETAFAKGSGSAIAFVEDGAALTGDIAERGIEYTVDGRPFRRIGFSSKLRCDDCDLEYVQPEPRLYSFNSPLGACPGCEGFGSVVEMDMELVVPNRNVSLRDGAIAPWNTPAYAHELEELLALADEYDLPVDVPFADLNAEHLRLIHEGVPERDFGGLSGFFAWLERRTYKMHLRVFLSRWRSYGDCPVCHGARLRPEALDTYVGGLNIVDVLRRKVSDASEFFKQLELTDWQQAVGRMMLDQIRTRLAFLERAGLGYLTLDRAVRTLSGGEARRVALASALGSSLVNMLYVLDEPTIGLHPVDTEHLIRAILDLRDRANTVVVVEHEESMLRAADQLIEIGPSAGEQGGRVVFQGTPEEIQNCPNSVTGDYLAGRRQIRAPIKRRTPDHGWIRLVGARGNNLKNITVEFPLGLLCVITGVSGSGKSTLVQDTLYPALSRRLRKTAPKPYGYDDVIGDGQVDEVIFVDQSPIGRSPRSNPVTYIKAFDQIRTVFADTVLSRTRNYTAGHFSFNAEGGRCNACKGVGYTEIDMQFMADVFMPCADCQGTRYRQEILDVTYRGRNIADVLEMTVREASMFFRGHSKVQARLKRLTDVGLDYLRLGQPANTLSGGEAQRLKLAAYMSRSKRRRCLFILDEPTTGLHFHDVVQLLDCFEALLSVGHSLLVVEHNLHLIKTADHVIDLGPGAADNGGQVIAEGTPEMVSRVKESATGKYLGGVLADDFQEQSA